MEEPGGPGKAAEGQVKRLITDIIPRIPRQAGGPMGAERPRQLRPRPACRAHCRGKAFDGGVLGAIPASIGPEHSEAVGGT